jgi:hypothetical protein
MDSSSKYKPRAQLRAPMAAVAHGQRPRLARAHAATSGR